MKKKFWVYMITNLITGKKYIGQTNDIWKRKSAHKREKDKGTYIANSIKRYGWVNHKVKVIFYCENIAADLANQIETYYIRYYNTVYPFNKNGMNLQSGGHNKACERGQKLALASRHKAYMRKIKKVGVPIEIYSKDGDFLFSHLGSPRSLLIKLEVPEEKLLGKVPRVHHHLKSGGLVFLRKYIMQWEGEDRVSRYKEALSLRMIQFRAIKRNTAPAIEKTRKPVKNLVTGEIYVSVAELCRQLGIDRSLFRWKLKNQDQFKNLYNYA